jgi:hypothetical protein
MLFAGDQIKYYTMVGVGIDGDNIKVDRKEIKFVNVYWIYLVQHTAINILLNAVMNNRVL